jgi:hypothetical protein
VRRLPEQFDPTDPNDAYAAALFATVTPLEPSPWRKRRVWFALQERPARRPLGRTGGVVVAGLLLCGATAAGATMSHFWTSWHRSTEIAAVTPVTAPDPPPPARPAPAEPMVPQVGSPPAVPKPAPAKARATEGEASAALMVEAMRARRAGNFARARELASEYRLKYPNSALNEEALALSIEAAVALGEGDAYRLAALYLQRYPHGRFRGQAQRALATSR